jgi:hypothetical protein
LGIVLLKNAICREKTKGTPMLNRVNNLAVEHGKPPPEWQDFTRHALLLKII